MPGTPSPLERFPPTLLGRSRVSGPPALLKLLDAIIASLGDGRTSAGPRGFCKTSCSKSGAHAEVKHGEESCPHRPRSCNVLRAPARRKNVGGRGRGSEPHRRKASCSASLQCSPSDQGYQLGQCPRDRAWCRKQGVGIRSNKCNGIFYSLQSDEMASVELTTSGCCGCLR